MNQNQLIQSIMEDILNSPSPVDSTRVETKFPLESFKAQTFNNYKKIIQKTTNDDLALYLPEMFINMLSGVTFFNQYLLLLNIHLEKFSSSVHNDKDYIRHLLETSFAHTGKFRGYEKFQNNLPFLSNNLLSALSNESFNQDKINRLKKISILFIILEEFFRNHQAHGFTHSLIDFFRGFNIGIQPVYLFNDNYLKDFSTFTKLEHKFYFLCPKEEYEHFKSVISSHIHDITNYETTYSTEILHMDVKNKILNLFGISKDIIAPKAKWKEATNPIIAHLNIGDSEYVLINSDIARSYFKYYSLVFNREVNAKDLTLIKQALVLNEFSFQLDGFKFLNSFPINPQELLFYFEEFINIIEEIFPKPLN